MVDYKSALYVTTLAECGSIRAAAEKLYISPPALSMYIRNLERGLGTPLFVRSPKHFELTEVGRCFVNYSRQLLALNQQFEEELDLYRRREKKTCSIGVYRRRGNHFMVPLLQALDRELPEIRFEFQVGSMQELEQMLESRKLDYVLVTHLIRRPGWEYLHVCRDELMLICPESLRHLTETVPDSPYPVLLLSGCRRKS